MLLNSLLRGMEFCPKKRLIKEEMKNHRLFKRTDDFPKGARPGKVAGYHSYLKAVQLLASTGKGSAPVSF